MTDLEKDKNLTHLLSENSDNTSINNLSKPFDILDQPKQCVITAKVGGTFGDDKNLGTYNSKGVNLKYQQNTETTSLNAGASYDCVNPSKQGNYNVLSAQTTGLVSTTKKSFLDADSHRLFLSGTGEGSLILTPSSNKQTYAATALAGSETKFDADDRQIKASLYAGVKGKLKDNMSIKPAFVSGGAFETSYKQSNNIRQSVALLGAQEVEKGQKIYVGKLEGKTTITKNTSKTSIFGGVELQAEKELRDLKADKDLHLYAGAKYQQTVGKYQVGIEGKVKGTSKISCMTSVNF